MIPGGDVATYEPRAATRVTPPISRELVALDDGGVALGLDPSDDLQPHWLAWNEWVDARQPCLAVALDLPRS